MTTNASRRHFLRTLSGLAATGATRPIAVALAAMASATAQAATDYRAVVCIYMGGGNDHLSTIVPYDSASYAAYANARGHLAIPRAQLAPIRDPAGHGGLQLAFSPALRKIKALSDAGHAVVVSNVGSLIQPTTKASIVNGTAVLPSLLASHADQHNTWLSLGTTGPDGWGGRMGDVLAAGNGNAAFTSISATGGSTLLLSGRSSQPFTVSSYGAPQVFFNPGSPLEHAVTNASVRRNLLERAVSSVYDSLRDNSATLGAAMLADTVFPVPPAQNYLADQLLTIARIVGGATTLNVRRQIFFVEFGGFDTHDGQAVNHPALMKILDDAVGYFNILMTQIGAWNKVTLMTLSEFGRQLSPNNDGTDHGWGSHHIVTGGAVAGGIRGTIPTVAIDGNDFLGGGFMIPTTSIEQYGASIARWMGLAEGDVQDIFPHITRYTTRDLALFV